MNTNKNRNRSGTMPRRKYYQNDNRRNNRRSGSRKMATFNPAQFINSNPIEESAEICEIKNSFADFKLDSKLIQNIIAQKITTPTPIQDRIIPEILKNNDVIGLAETGTGKTAAFLIPLIENTLKDRGRQTLILTPTRELALQIDDEFKKFARGLRLFSVLCVGGLNIRPQIEALRRHNHFIIGTPGRIMDLIERGNFKPSGVKSVVLDEADRMLDMGFINDIKSILTTTPKDRETFLFSATIDQKTKEIVNDFLNKAVTVSVKKRDVTNSIKQDVIMFDQKTKFEKLEEILKKSEFKRVLIFGSMKHSVEKLAQQLSKNNILAESIHGNKSHIQRQRALNNFKNNRIRVLVATDVAARGIHIDNVTHVINYDLPNTFEDYVHRIGRTGRCTNQGIALTFIPKHR